MLASEQAPEYSLIFCFAPAISIPRKSVRFSGSSETYVSEISKSATASCRVLNPDLEIKINHISGILLYFLLILA